VLAVPAKGFHRKKSPGLVFGNAAVMVLPDVFAALRQLLLTRLLPCGKVYGVRAIRFLVSTMPAELRKITLQYGDHRRAVMEALNSNRELRAFGRSGKQLASANSVLLVTHGRLVLEQ
jgi:hypothetical protein